MRIDFHTHAILTKRYRFNLEYFDSMVRGAIAGGLDAVVLTEHFNTMRFHELYDSLDREIGFTGHYYRAGELRVYPGMEVDVAEGIHTLLFGALEGIRSLRGTLEDHTSVGRFVAIARLRELADENGLFLWAAHPLRPGRELRQVAPEERALVDMLELNAKDLYFFGARMRENVVQLAVELGRPVVAGSDAHHYLQLGTVWSEIPNGCESPQEIAEAIRAGESEIHQSPCLPTKVEAARIVKKTIKQYELPPVLPLPD